jgi:hypothetical protein
VIVFAIAVAFSCMYRVSLPDGVYYDPYIGCIGDAHWVFEKGRLIVRTPESGPDEFLATYREENGRWLMENTRGETVEMRFTATLLGIKIHDSSNQQRDKFMFRRSFAWLPKSWAWVESHLPGS